MATHKLNNYLRMYRRRASLTQNEIAYLLGCKDRQKISCYEHSKRTPILEAALAYEIIFGIPARQLFIGVFARVEKQVLRRIGHLGRKLQLSQPSRISQRKLEILAAALKTSRERHG